MTSNCPNCGAPHEPLHCSYCLTPTQVIGPDEAAVVFDNPSYEGWRAKAYARYGFGATDYRKLFDLDPA